MYKDYFFRANVVRYYPIKITYLLELLLAAMHHDKEILINKYI